MTQLDLCIRKIKSSSKERDKSQGEHLEGSCNRPGKMVYVYYKYIFWIVTSYLYLHVFDVPNTSYLFLHGCIWQCPPKRSFRFPNGRIHSRPQILFLHLFLRVRFFHRATSPFQSLLKPQYSFSFLFPLFTPSAAYSQRLRPLGLLYSCLRLCPLGGCFPHGYLHHLKLGLKAQPSRPAHRLSDSVVLGRNGGWEGKRGGVGVVSSVGLTPQGLETQRWLHPQGGGDDEGRGGRKSRPG